MSESIPSLREFMRARRPERFSDSLPVEHSALDRAVLEYHLDSLTSRSQETDFEHFAKAICEREICPNLVPHTGPTGGGDSKVDTETFPVADQLAMGWFQGVGRDAANERWAFAFSAKEDWRTKIRSDVKSIVGTGRPYKKIFFITNQFVKDKLRATVATELSEEFSVDVHIHDRTFLVDAVVTRGLEDVAIATLGVPSALRKDIRKGPRDVRREQTLQETEKRIADSLASGSPGMQVVDDAIKSALAARGLDRTRVEIDGRFVRARDLAAKYGTRHQQLRAAYNWAWTTFWWFEDLTSFSTLYSHVEELALGSEGIYQLELLCNLWMCLNNAVAAAALDAESTKLAVRTDALSAALSRIADEQGKHGAALHAKTLALQMRLMRDHAQASEVFAELKTVIEQADHLPSFPFQTIAEIVSELGGPLGDAPGYDELFKVVVEKSGKREGEVIAARMLVQRGAQLLEHDKPYDAIATLGSALSRLYREESRADVIRALYMCGHAYAAVDLKWAARGAMANAASLASASTWNRGEVTLTQVACCAQMKSLELGLGRLPQTLDWHQTERVLHAVAAGSNEPDGFDEFEGTFDGVMGLQFLMADLSTLRLLESLPSVLRRLGLGGAAIALLFALGYENEVPDDWMETDELGAPSYSFFARWRAQPAASELRSQLSVGIEPKLLMQSDVLGCHIQLECDNLSPCVELAESVMAAIESFLSTGLAVNMIAHEPQLSISVRNSEYGDPPFSSRMTEEKGRPHLVIACHDFKPHVMSLEQQKLIQDRLTEIVIEVFAHAFFAKDIEQTMTTLFRDERALERAVAFTRSFVTIGNVLGRDAKATVSSWVNVEDQTYPLKRSQPWDSEEREARASEAAGTKAARSHKLRTAGSGEPPPALLESHRTAKQSDIKTVSLIRTPLWNRAKWRGVGTGGDLAGAEPPFLALIFEEGEPAAEIFEGWREDLGPRDEHRQLTVSIIRGFSKEKPAAYRVVIGSNPNYVLGDPETKFAIMGYRIHTMEPSSTENLDRFLAAYAAAGKYILAPAIVVAGEPLPRVGVELGIEKAELQVKAAWQVGRHDSESVAIDAEDDPIIPLDQPNPPIAEVLAAMRERGNKDRS